jgi:hypothetical protein
LACGYNACVELNPILLETRVQDRWTFSRSSEVSEIVMDEKRMCHLKVAYR